MLVSNVSNILMSSIFFLDSEMEMLENVQIQFTRIAFRKTFSAPCNPNCATRVSIFGLMSIK